MSIADQIHSSIRNLDVITPFDIVRIIQDFTAFPLDRAIKGYFHYKSEYIDELQHIEAHESMLTSPQLAALASLDLKICNHTTKKESVSEALKIGYLDMLNGFNNIVDVYKGFQKWYD